MRCGNARNAAALSRMRISNISAEKRRKPLMSISKPRMKESEISFRASEKPSRMNCRKRRTATKKHIGLYPGPEAVEHFSEKLDAHGFKHSKGSIQIPYSDELSLSLISAIAAWCRDTGNHA